MGEDIPVGLSEAAWVAIALPGMPDEQDTWGAQRLDLELDDVLTTRTYP